LIVSSEYLKKPSLLGQDYFVRHDSNGHVIYAGAFFNYLLVPIILVTKNVIVITALFTILNLATGYIIFWVAKKIFGLGVGLLSATIFLFNSYMIYHSLFIWIYNLLPLIGILTIYFLYLYKKKRNIRYVFSLGFLSGVGISLQILYAPIAMIVVSIVYWKSTKKFLTTVNFIIGASIANLPMIIFDIRHNFYHLSTFAQYFIDSLVGKSNAALSYYHLLPFWPVFAIVVGWMIMKVFKLNKTFGLILVLLYLFLNLSSTRVNLSHSTGMSEGLYVRDVDEASKKIALDAKGPFNVAEVLDFDKQAYVLRYFVEYKYGIKPLDVENYPNAKLLYVLAPKNYSFAQSDIWEICSGGPFKVELFYSVNDSYGVYKLTRNK